jgi:hypothetical protein
MNRLALVLIFISASYAQTTVVNGNRQNLGFVDFSNSTYTATIRTGLIDPVTCNASVFELFINRSTAPAILKYCSSSNSWSAVGASGGVSSVGLTLPNIFTVTGSPVTGSGTLAGSLASQAANLIFASPDGTSGTPSFRMMTPGDIPNFPASKVNSGVFGLGNGSNTAPTYSFAASTGTGMYYSGTDLSFAVGGIRRIYANGTDVGIGIPLTLFSNLAIAQSATATNTISIGGDDARDIIMGRHSTADTAGNSLILRSGGSTLGATNKNGGDLTLSSGINTGTGSSKINLQAYPPGSSGTTSGTAVTSLLITGYGPQWPNVAEPTCNSTNRGQLLMVQNTTGVADTFRVCAKGSDDVYYWTALY